MGVECCRSDPREIRAAVLGTYLNMSHPAQHLAEIEYPSAQGAVSLAGATRRELAAALAGAGVPEREIRMRVAQLWRWIYHAGANTFEPMANVSKVLRGTLAEHFTLARPKIAAEQVSGDGSGGR